MMRSVTSRLLRNDVRATPLLGGVRGLAYSAHGTGWRNPNPHPDGYFHSEREAEEMFEEWCKVYKKTFPSEEVKRSGYSNFREKFECSTRRNQEFDDPRYRCFDPNCFADRSYAELRALSNGYWGPDKIKRSRELRLRKKSESVEESSKV